MKNVNFVVTDLDDTIWDWLEMWYMSFGPYLDRIAKETGIDIGILTAEFKQLHQKYGTTEISFAYKELPSITEQHYHLFEGSSELKNILHEYNSNKKNSLKTYDGVVDTLKYIKAKGTKIVAFTESNVFFTKYRIKHLELDGIIDAIYSPAGSAVPETVDIHYSESFWEPQQTTIKTLPEDTRKPNKKILEAILNDFGASKENAIYIGDKLDRDIYMAQQAGMTSVHASYGHQIDGAKYELLVAVTHWKDEDVLRERNFKNQAVAVKKPDYTINQFEELKTLFNYTKF